LGADGVGFGATGVGFGAAACLATLEGFKVEPVEVATFELPAAARHQKHLF